MGDLFNLNKTRATRAKGTTTTMANNSKTNVTVADVAAQAAEEKLVVPTQAEGQKMTEEKIEVTEESAPTVIEGAKKSLKERAKNLVEKVEKNKKAFIAVGIAAAAATVAVAKVVAKRSLEKELAQAERAEDESSDESSDERQNEIYQELKDKAVSSDETAA